MLRLPIRIAELAVRAAKTTVQLAGAAAQAALERVRGREDDRTGEGTPSAPAATTTAGAPPPTSPPPHAAPAPPPVLADSEPAPLNVVPEPTPGQAARIRSEQREAERTEDSPGAQVRVDEPWAGYAAMDATEIVDRLGDADDAVRGVVLLYERTHRNRKTVVEAAGG